MKTARKKNKKPMYQVLTERLKPGECVAWSKVMREYSHKSASQTVHRLNKRAKLSGTGSIFYTATKLVDELHIGRYDDDTSKLMLQIWAERELRRMPCLERRKSYMRKPAKPKRKVVPKPVVVNQVTGTEFDHANFYDD